MLLNAPPPTPVRAAFLVDADNVPPALVEFALQQLERRGCTVPLRRVYGGHEKLLGLKTIIQRHGLRAFVNQGKGTTDVALVVDAMDLLHASALPPTVAIVSSDHDFAPLALRLRESGHRVWCFAQQAQASVDDLAYMYDEVICMPSMAAPLAAVVSAPSAPVPPPPIVELVLQSSSVLLPDVVSSIRAAVPDWKPGEVKPLNVLGALLRAAGVAVGSKPLHQLFRRYPDDFEVLPLGGPAREVRLQGQQG